jgi:(E)-4-hydroxy-3-methylbut-2-enyl-diphosphate synthase
LIKGTAGIATLLSEGIGDTIRYSLTADPVEEARAGRQLLEALGLRERKGLDLIACPSCGRAEIDVIGVAKAAQEALEGRKLPIQVAVMGCVVNGPGESKHANLGISLPGTFEEPKAPVYVDGRLMVTLKGDHIVAEFIKILDEYVDSHYGAKDAVETAAKA